MDQDILIAVYGVLQSSLRKSDLLGHYAQPIDKKGACEEDVDTIALYRWLSNYLRKVSEKELNRRKDIFNNYVRKLDSEYYLNNLILVLFLMEDEVGMKGNTPQKIVLMPKLNRLIKIMRTGIITTAEEAGDNGPAIVRDSKIAASNIARLFRGQPVLNKEMRALNAQKWKNVARSFQMA